MIGTRSEKPIILRDKRDKQIKQNKKHLSGTGGEVGVDHEFQDVLNDVRMPDESRVRDAGKGARLEASAVPPRRFRLPLP